MLAPIGGLVLTSFVSLLTPLISPFSLLTLDNFRTVFNDPALAGSPVGRGTYQWDGASGVWFWIDPENDLLFVGMIQRMGGTGGDDLGTMARTLTYQALLHPEK